MVARYSASICRRKSDAAQRKAKGCRDPEARRHYEEIARQWLEMAGQIERNDDASAGLLIEVVETPKWRN